MNIIIFLIIIIVIYIIFIFINNLFKKKYEHFEKIPDEDRVCGTLGNECIIDNSDGKNSCCDGYKCLRPNGNFHNKICMLDYVNSTTNITIDNGEINVPDIDIPDISTSNLKMPGIDIGEITNINVPNMSLPGLNLPNLYLPNPNLPSTELENIKTPTIDLPKFSLPEFGLPNVFTNKYWHNLVACPVNEKKD